MQNEIPFTSYIDLLNSDAGGEQLSGSQETHNSSQGFISNLANDEELFGGIRPDEDINGILAPPPAATCLQLPLSPGSTVSVESMETITDLVEAKDSALPSTLVYKSLMKEEIRTKLKLRQMCRGIDPDEDTAPWRQPKTTSEQKSPEALRRIEERKMRNRIAARKCRMKKRRSEEILREDLNRLTTENARLKAKVAQNRREYEQLMAALTNHPCMMTVRRPSSPDL